MTDDIATELSRKNEDSFEAAVKGLAELAGWKKPPKSQFEEVMGASEEEVAKAHMAPDYPLRTKRDLLRRLQLQYGYRNAHWNGRIKPRVQA